MNAVLKIAYSVVLLIIGAVAGVAGAMSQFAIEDTVVSMPVAEGLTAQDVGDSFLSKAAELNMKYVGHQPLSEELRARGLDSGDLHIYQFCNPEDARKMVDRDMSFAAYMPCRIVIVEDPEGKLHVQMLDLDLMMQFAELDGQALSTATRVRDTLAEIMRAGAAGDF